MSFLDDLGKKITATGQSALQKTKDSAEVVRLGSTISELEKLAESSYTQIGRLYASLHPKDYEEDFAGMMTTVAATELKIRELKDQRMALRGMVRCEKCGGEVPGQYLYCENCGAELPRKKYMENMTRCEGCGEMVAKDMKFCPSCGRCIAAVEAAEPIVTEICPQCGAEIEPNSSFCPQCGFKLTKAD